jgi:hypothetical protein
MAQVIDRQEVHDLVDRMPAERLAAAASLLKSMFADPEDGEPVTEEDIERFRQAKAALARGDRGTPMEEVLAEFGLTMDDFPLDK